MPTYNVRIERITKEWSTLEVEAENEQQAGDEALEIALRLEDWCLDFYKPEVVSIEELEPTK